LQVALLVSTANTFSFQFDHLTINDYIFSNTILKSIKKINLSYENQGNKGNRCPIECGRLVGVGLITRAGS